MKRSYFDVQSPSSPREYLHTTTHSHLEEEEEREDRNDNEKEEEEERRRAYRSPIANATSSSQSATYRTRIRASNLTYRPRERRGSPLRRRPEGGAGLTTTASTGPMTSENMMNLLNNITYSDLMDSQSMASSPSCSPEEEVDISEEEEEERKEESQRLLLADPLRENSVPEGKKALFSFLTESFLTYTFFSRLACPGTIMSLSSSTAL